MPLSLFSNPDDGWKQFIQDHETQIAQKNQLINDRLKSFLIAGKKLNVLQDLLKEVGDLTKSTAALADKAAAAQAEVMNVNSKTTQMMISVGALSDSFDQLDDPTKKFLSTSDFIKRIADAGTTSLSVDFPAMQKVVDGLLQYLQKIPIPKTAPGVSREGASGETPESAINALVAALSSPKPATLPTMFEGANSTNPKSA